LGLDGAAGDFNPLESSPRRFRTFATGVLQTASGRIGLALLIVALAVALLGPLFAPYGYDQLVGRPYAGPSAQHLLGTDFLGRDALSRVLDGGRTVLIVAALSTLLAYAIGVPIGIISGYRRGPIDLGVTALVDVILSFPSLVFVLVLLAAAGPHLSVVVIGIAATYVPRIIRIVRAATIDVASLDFVEAAVARGESLFAIARRDILPNITTPLITDVGLRFTFAVLLYSSLAYLGLGQPPPAADWGLIINENQIALTYQPLASLAPACMIAILAVGASLLSDGIARTVGRSVLQRDA
jgi:peptide/nickel transport system permease protein